MIEKEDLNASREPDSLEAFVLIREVSLGSDALSVWFFIKGLAAQVLNSS